MQREASMSGQKGFTAWFTGLPCSGKTSVADRVAEILRERGLARPLLLTESPRF
jgi:adenylylsulfate kinase-like enzyme